MSKALKQYTRVESFTPANVTKASFAAGHLCQWVLDAEEVINQQHAPSNKLSTIETQALEYELSRLENQLGNAKQREAYPKWQFDGTLASIPDWYKKQWNLGNMKQKS